jgi:hypothetical protein
MGRYVTALFVGSRTEIAQPRCCVPQNPAEEDQCVFIRGFRVTRTFKILPKQLKAAAGPSSDPDENDSEPELELTSMLTAKVGPV